MILCILSWGTKLKHSFVLKLLMKGQSFKLFLQTSVAVRCLDFQKAFTKVLYQSELRRHVIKLLVDKCKKGTLFK